MDIISSCICCGRSLNRIGGRAQRRSLPLSSEFIQNHLFLLAYLANVANIFQFGETDRICRPCLQRAQRMPQIDSLEFPETTVPFLSEDDANNIETPVVMPSHNLETEENERHFVNREVQVNMNQRWPIPGYRRASFNTHNCIFDRCNNLSLQRIDVIVRQLILEEKSFYIPLGSRVCEEHRLDGPWQDIDASCRHVYDQFTSLQASDMLNLLRKKKIFLDFQKLQTIKDEVFHYYIGFSKNQFQEILQYTPSIGQRLRKPGKALATVLFKLRTGDSNQRLASLFMMTRKTFEKIMKIARDCLTSFVSRNLGFDHLTRQDVIARCLAVPKALFNAPHEAQRQAIIIQDGTYIYLQKSSNYYFQRKTYSLHKFKNLVKPYILVCPDGHIIDIYGPYEATKSDASILHSILNDPSDPLNYFFEEGDVFILDRGFRDVIEELKSFGYNPYMPLSKNENETQLNTMQANHSRKVTMCRWVIETVNGRLKNQFRQLRHQYFNKAAENLFEEVRIAAALLNAFGKPLQDHRLAQEIIEEVHRRETEENLLGYYVTVNNLNRHRVEFQSIDANVPGLDDFPRLTRDDLILFSLGTYQLKQARSYYGEHVKNGSYIIEVCKELNLLNLHESNMYYNNPWLVRGRIQPRHTNRRIYYVYILIEGDVEGRDAIVGYYCTCVIGMRTLGCCSHTMSIVWFLGWARYQENLSPPALFLDSIILRHDLENEEYEETA